MNNLNFETRQIDFIKHLELQEKSFNTIKNYKTDLNIFKQFLISKGRKLELNEVSSTLLNEYNLFLNKKYSGPNSIRRRVQALRLFFDFLIGQGLFHDNPVKKMLVEPKVVDIPRPPSFGLVRKLKKGLQHKIDSSKGHDQLLAQRNILLFDLIYGAGLKVSNIEKLQLSHINKVEGHYRATVISEKRETYTVALDQNFGESYEKYLILLETGKNRAQLEFSHLLFNANPFKILKGGLSSRGIEVIFKEFTRKMELKTSITAKSLRQACIFKWLNTSIPQSRIKEWMGVQPQYSLKPFITLLEESPENFAYIET